MAKKSLHQTVSTMLTGDATSDHIFLLREWLRELGFESEIYSQYCADELTNEVKAFDIGKLKDESLVIFHHTMGSDVLAKLIEEQVPLLLIYHNITPPEFFGDIDVGLAQQLVRGREQLAQARPITRLALGKSPYSQGELLEVGFEHTGVLPIVFDKSQYALPADETLLLSLQEQGPLLVFVGRISPNKRQEDLIKLLYYYRRIEPQARLALVGSFSTSEYVHWLHKLAAKHDLSDAVIFTGHITQQEMITYFKAADLFVSMSEHEGFGKPLIESMYFQLPVLAFASTAIPSTMGSAGVLFTEKDFEALAEIADLMIRNEKLRCRIIEEQSKRVDDFDVPTVRQKWCDYLNDLGIM